MHGRLKVLVTWRDFFVFGYFQFTLDFIFVFFPQHTDASLAEEKSSDLLDSSTGQFKTILPRENR